jgi:Ni,Fe-hydrogenase I cytochrome b subunit
MTAIGPVRPPIGETYYPPRYPAEPPNDHIQPLCLITASRSAVEFTTERGTPDIKGYLLMHKRIDIHRARNPVEIRVFQRVYSIETLSSLTGLPIQARFRIQRLFYHIAAEMRSRQNTGMLLQPDFWSLFNHSYIKDMIYFRGLILRRYPYLGQEINWAFLLHQPCTDVAVMVYLWVLGAWQLCSDKYKEALLGMLGTQLCSLVPSRRFIAV